MKLLDKVWFTAKELEGLNGLPSHATNITRKAKNEKWLFRKAKGVRGGGFEYHLSSLPSKTQESLALRDGIETAETHLQDAIEKYEIEEKEHIRSYQIEQEYYYPIDDFRGERVSIGLENKEQYDAAYIMVERSWFQRTGNNSQYCAMFTITGECMEPTLKDGEEIIVDRSKRELIEGKIFVLNHNGSMLVKKVQFTYNGVELISDNSIYRPLKLNTDEINNLIIIGQVVRSYRDF